MNNLETLAQAEAAIAALEEQFSNLDELAADAGTAEKTVKAVESEISALHSNANGLEMKARSNRLKDLNSTCELHRSDAKHLRAAVDAQKRKVIEAGGIARQSTLAIWSAAHIQRKVNAVEMIRGAFDLRRCAITAETLAPSERGYLQSCDAEYFFTSSARTTELKCCGNCRHDSRLCAKWPKRRQGLIYRQSFPSPSPSLNPSEGERKEINMPKPTRPPSHPHPTHIPPTSNRT